MTKLSYSFHISNGKNAINTAKNLERALKHNLRAYTSETRSGVINDTLIGSTSSKGALNDFQRVLNENTEIHIQEFNATKKSNRDKIDNYFNKISNDKKTELATEIIIQVGDMDFWKNKTLEQKKLMNSVFQSQLDKLQQECPDYKIVNATVHYDENSPHMQIIGIPIAKYEKGLKSRIAKTKVFTKDSLERLQESMRDNVLEQMQSIYGNNINLKPKEKGRNNDFLIEEYKKIKEQSSEYAEFISENLKKEKKKLDYIRENEEKLKEEFRNKELDEIKRRLSQQFREANDKYNNKKSNEYRKKTKEKLLNSKNIFNKIDIKLVNTELDELSNKYETELKEKNELLKKYEASKSFKDLDTEQKKINRSLENENEKLKQELIFEQNKNNLIYSAFEQLYSFKDFEKIKGIFELADKEKTDIWGLVSEKAEKILDKLNIFSKDRSR